MGIYKTARQAAKQSPRHVYQLWGEYKRPESNARSLYRNGDVCAWCRYIVKPRDGLLWYGWTLGDTVVLLGVAAIMVPLALLAIDVWGAAFDRCADRLGW